MSGERMCTMCGGPADLACETTYTALTPGGAFYVPPLQPQYFAACVPCLVKHGKPLSDAAVRRPEPSLGARLLEFSLKGKPS